MNETLSKYVNLREFDLIHDDLARKFDRVHISLSLLFFMGFVSMLLLCGQAVRRTADRYLPT